MDLMSTVPIPALLVWRRFVPVAVVAAAVNAALWGLGTLAGADLQVPGSVGGADLVDLSIVRVLVFTVGALAVATLWMSVLLKALGPRGVLVFNLSVVLVFLLSLGAPLGLDIGAGGKALLALMHLVVALAAFFGLGRSILR